jgi:hypothetical protein
MILTHKHVMAGLDPAIHIAQRGEVRMDPRVKPEGDRKKDARG